ncbi:AAA family ATPase [Pseudomonas sp. S1(2024)]|uniref:AAA family ATPase n=1 Tax=Pseudomonas sp. S1(2024) TaxID=3390191 RepID=UPI00397B786A
MIVDIDDKNCVPLRDFLQSLGLDEGAELVESKHRLIKGSDNKAICDLGRLKLEHYEAIQQFAKEQGFRGLQMLATTIINVLTKPDQTKVRTLKALPNVLIEHFMGQAIDGWVYMENNGIFLPYLIGKIRYEPEKKTSYGTNPAEVTLELLANVAAKSKGNQQVGSKKITFLSETIAGVTLPELLRNHGIHVETPELKADYERQMALFLDYQPRHAEQFLLSGMTFSGEDLDRMGVAHRLGEETTFRAINEEAIIQRVFIDEIDNEFWSERYPGAFSALPYHPLIYFFNLETHAYAWAHVDHAKPYVYKPELREKLVLPEDHKTLIDILASDMEMLSDIVQGKSGGTCILCSGAPGLGKTLTAEVYSEVVARPLYRVHSGQLGIQSDEVENNLKMILMRAQRWNAVLLIDEACVYIRMRGNDLEHNAVVASFLRNLEYFSGLLFMTTNRPDDVDQAIVSRCVAHIRYVVPDDVTRRKLWQVLGENYNAGLSETLLDQLCEKFTSVGGRDIKELLKLTLKFAKGRKLPVSIELFTQCAQFRGL